MHIVAAIVLLVLSYREFWAKVRRARCSRRPRCWSPAGDRNPAVLGSGRALPRIAGAPRPAAVCGQPGGRVRARRIPDLFTGKPHVLLNAIFGLFGALALIAAAIVLFQSQRADNALTGEDESAIRGLLELYGKNDSLGYFATRRDKSVVFAQSGRAAITYRVEVGVCLASGDPVGDPRAWPQADRRVAGAVQNLRLGARESWAPVRRGPGIS